MKKVIIVAILILLGGVGKAQTSRATGGIEDVLTADTILNNFMLQWIIWISIQWK